MRTMSTDEPLPETDEDAIECILAHAHNLYRLRRKSGKSIIDALTSTLEDCVAAIRHAAKGETQ